MVKIVYNIIRYRIGNGPPHGSVAWLQTQRLGQLAGFRPNTHRPLFETNWSFVEIRIVFYLPTIESRR